MTEMVPGSERETLELLELVTRQTAVAVTRCSRDFRYLWANQAYADWLQRPLDAIVGQHIVDVLGTDAFESLRSHFERVLAGENVSYEQELDLSGIGKRWISANYTPLFDVGTTTGGSRSCSILLNGSARRRSASSMP